MLNQIETNKYLWEICDNFKNKTEVKKNYIVYISVLLYIRYNPLNKCDFDEIYNSKNNYYIGDIIDKKIQKIEDNDKELFSNIQFKNIKIYREIGEKSIIEKTIEEIYFLSSQVQDERNIAKAYEYVIEQAVYRNDIIKDRGEFYTPEEIAKVMAKLIVTKDNIDVYDPICGSGNLLKSALKTHKVKIYGKETNLDYYNILKTRLLLNQVNNYNIVYGKEDIHREIKADVIMFNPPFADKTWKNNNFIKNPMFENRVVQPMVGDYVYVINMLDKLKENGKMAVILPHGVLFRENEKRIREKLIDGNFIETIIGLPENLFHNTRISVIIMIISKNRKEEDILFIDASQDYESDRKNNILAPEYQEKIINTYIKKKNIENYSHLVTKREIIDNEFDLTIKKYIQKRKKVEVVDKEEIAQNVKKLKSEQEKLEENIKDVLEALGYRDIGETKYTENKEKNKKETYKEEKERNYGNIDYNLVGERIRKTRMQKGITLSDMAMRTETSLGFLSRIERGASQINLKRLLQVCEILDVSIEKILIGE